MATSVVTRRAPEASHTASHLTRKAGVSQLTVCSCVWEANLDLLAHTPLVPVHLLFEVAEVEEGAGDGGADAGAIEAQGVTIDNTARANQGVATRRCSGAPS